MTTSNDSSKYDCNNQRDCLEKLQSVLDDEATPEQKEHFLKVHLDQCMPCYKNYHLEVAIRELLKSKCNGCAPTDLIESIRSKVLQNLAH